MHWIKSRYNNNQSVYFRLQPFFVCTASDLQQARQRCCPLLQSAKTHPEPRGQTCPSNPSAPACPHSPPWMTCCLLVLYTAKGKWGISEHCSRTRQQELSPATVGLFFSCRSKWACSSWMAFKVDKLVYNAYKPYLVYLNIKSMPTGNTWKFSILNLQVSLTEVTTFFPWRLRVLLKCLNIALKLKIDIVI